MTGCITCHAAIFRIRTGHCHLRSHLDRLGLSRYQRTTIFRIRTGHCHLHSHLDRLGLSHTTDCLRETATQTPDHILQSCSLHKKSQEPVLAPGGYSAGEAICGSQEHLEKTQFTSSSPQTRRPEVSSFSVERIRTTYLCLCLSVSLSLSLSHTHTHTHTHACTHTRARAWFYCFRIPVPGCCCCCC